MGNQIITQPQTFNAGVTVVGNISATGTIYGTVPLADLATAGATAGQVVTFNSSTNTWVASAAGGGTGSGIAPVITTATGDGTSTAFTISGYTTTSPNSYLIHVDGLTQRPTTDYTVSTNTINFTTAPPNGTQILVMAWQSSPAAANNTTINTQNNGGSTSSASTLNFTSGLAGTTSSGTTTVSVSSNVTTQTATYTIALADNNSVVQMNSSSALTLVVPTDASVAFPVGSQVIVSQKGTGQVTLSGAAGVTIASNSSKIKTTGQNSAAVLIKLASNSWLLGGDISA
jgi:hypothetical protein